MKLSDLRSLRAVLVAVVLLFAPGVRAGASERLPAQAEALLSGCHRIVFLGDSITQAGDYVVDVDCWLLSRGLRLETINLGLGSETATDLTPEENADHVKRHGFARPFVSERLERALAATKPDVLFACYGMNDSALPADAAGLRRFVEAVTRLREQALKAGVKQVVLCTPPVHDNRKDSASDPADQKLARYTEWLVGKRKDGWLVVDLHTPMRTALDRARGERPEFVFAKDGVHPGREGHWLMAQQLLKQAFGAEVGQLPSAEGLFPAQGPELRALVRERMQLLAGAWMTQIGHKRPGVAGGPKAKPGLPLAEAEARAAELGAQIDRQLAGQVIH